MRGRCPRGFELSKLGPSVGLGDHATNWAALIGAPETWRTPFPKAIALIEDRQEAAGRGEAWYRSTSWLRRFLDSIAALIASGIENRVIDAARASSVDLSVAAATETDRLDSKLLIPRRYWRWSG